MSSKSDSRDEVRTIIALGILAGIIAFFQLQASGNGFVFVNETIPNSHYGPLIRYELNLDLFVFGLYLLLFTIAMGLDAIWAGNLLADFVKDFANIAFFFGAISLAALGVMIFLFLKEQANLGPTPTNAIYNSATYEGYLLLLVILMLATFIAIDWARGKTKGTL